MQYQSPNQVKIKQLNDRLRELDHDDRLTPTSHQPRIHSLELRLHSLHQKIKKAGSKDDVRYMPLELEIAAAEDAFRLERRNFESGMGDREESIREIEKRIGDIVQRLGEEMRQERVGIVRGLEEKVRVVKQEYGENNRGFKQVCQKRCSEIGGRIEQVREAMDNERRSRDQTSQFLIRSFGEEILKLQELLNSQKTCRVRVNRDALSLISEVEDSLNEQIKEQKATKNRNEDVFTKLLEETCYKIEQSFLD